MRTTILAIALLPALLQGCKVGPDYARPELLTPDIWQQKAVKGLEVGLADLQTWWKMLDDPVLDELIEHAANDNLDLIQAWWRIVQARAGVGVAIGELYPQIDAMGEYSFQRFSTNGLQIGQSQNPGNIDLYAIGFDSTWEIDIFGRIRRAIESADASLQASVEDLRDIMVSLYAEVAVNYVEFRALQKRIKFAESNVQLQRKTLQLTKDLFKAGIVPQLDIRQAQLNVATTESAIPPLRFQSTAAANRLSVLLGLWPGELNDILLNEDQIPTLPKNITVDLPMELLRQRPDIRRAERVLASQTALIGVTTAELYPIFSLSGTFAYEAGSIDKLPNRASRTFNIGPAFSWNIFDADRTKNLIKIDEALAQEALANYENTVLVALEEAENAMTAYVQEYKRNDSLKESVTASKQSVDLVETLYKNGLTDFQNVLDMQRSLFA